MRHSRRDSTSARRADRRAALCLDASGTRRWLRLHKFYEVVRDPAVERDGLLRVKNEWGREQLFPATRFRFVEAPRSRRPDAARKIMADALEAAVRLQRRGLAENVGDAYVATLVRVFEADPEWEETVSLAIGFWQEWAEAARCGWRRSRARADFSEAEWPRQAREIVRTLRREMGSRPAWFRGVFGPEGRLA